MRWIIAGLIFCLITTAYFGWNLFPESGAEITCDLISVFIVMIGTIKEITKNEIKKHEKTYHIENKGFIFPEKNNNI